MLQICKVKGNFSPGYKNEWNCSKEVETRRYSVIFHRSHTVFSLLRLFTDMKNKILLVKSDTHSLERCFLVDIRSQSLQRLMYRMKEDRFGFRPGLWDYTEPLMFPK